VSNFGNRFLTEKNIFSVAKLLIRTIYLFYTIDLSKPQLLYNIQSPNTGYSKSHRKSIETDKNIANLYQKTIRKERRFSLTYSRAPRSYPDLSIPRDLVHRA